MLTLLDHASMNGCPKMGAWEATVNVALWVVGLVTIERMRVGYRSRWLSAAEWVFA